MNKVKMKCGAIVKDVPKGSMKWYIEAGWKIVEEKNSKEENKDDKADSKKTTTT